MIIKKIITKTTAPIISTLTDKKVKARVFNGDCMELLVALPDNSIDLTITSELAPLL